MRMDIVESLKAEVASEHVAYTEFMLAYKNKEKEDTLYCFYEGFDDPKYFETRIDLITNRDSRPFVCYGKDRLKSLVNLLRRKKEYSGALILFFLDKDFSQDETTGNIYVTPTYSVENFYVSLNVVKKVLSHECGLDVRSDDFGLSERLYVEAQEHFHNDLIVLNAWLACQSDIRIREQRKTYLNVDEVLKKYFKSIVKDDLVAISDFSELNDVDYLEQVLFPMAPKVDRNLLENKISSFKLIDKERYFRGKFELKFLVSFLCKLKGEIGKKDSDIFSEKHKCSLSFEFVNMISTLSQYAETPDCLRRFLAQYAM